ncbi:MAG: hypothetical protein C3F13_18155 [Anaerolineales bacterium]|nr:hypothetical protein [Anaerolineae bacterium]PWB49762.1 MAG: hypothetical protein C3F13_18155 [Anaerolineales bacterium]
MSLLSQLSSQVGDRSEASNLRVVGLCLEDPILLKEINLGLAEDDPALLGDCAEVITKVAETDPALVVPYAAALSVLLLHPNTRVRWEATHAIALIAGLVPAMLSALMPILVRMLREDQSVIVRDHAVDALGNYAATGAHASECVYPYLLEGLTLWDGKQAGHALHGLAKAAHYLPARQAELIEIANIYSYSDRPVIAKSAKELFKAVTS